MNALQQQAEKVDALRLKMKSIFDEGGEDLNLTDAQATEIKSLNDELTDETGKLERYRELSDMDRKNRESLAAKATGGRALTHGDGLANEKSAGDIEAIKTLGESFVGSEAYMAALNSKSKRFSVDVPNIEVKTVMSEGAGFAPQAIRTGVVVSSAQQEPAIIDVVPSTTTDMVAVVFMQESLYTNAAAEVAEGNLYAEAALQYAEVSSPVRKIGVYIPVTDEQLADVRGMQDRINNRLSLMMRQRLDSEIVNGNGTAPNLTGFLNTTGILTQARGTDVNVDAIYNGLTKIRYTGFANPSAILMNPLDWSKIRLLKTADGVYIYGFPGQDVAPRLWGLPVVQSTYVPQGTALAGDFPAYTEIAYKAGIEFEVSNSHSDYFVRGQLAIRCQLRAALVVYRPAALCTVTGL